MLLGVRRTSGACEKRFSYKKIMPIIISDHSSMTSLILLVLLIVTFAPPLSTTALTTTISVCQNKDCCQRFTSKSANLVQTLDHLLCTVDADSDVAVESSGCLGQCGQGPNIQVVQHQLTQSTILGHLETADAAAIALKGLNMTVHPTLLAASNVMERALRGTCCRTLHDKACTMLKRLSLLESPKRTTPISLFWCYLEPRLMSREFAYWSILGCAE